jgi:hypothetical protein
MVFAYCLRLAIVDWTEIPWDSKNDLALVRIYSNYTFGEGGVCIGENSGESSRFISNFEVYTHSRGFWRT